MHMSYSTLPLAATTFASLYLLLQSPDRKFATIAFIVSLVELLLAMKVMSFSIARFRIDLILAGALTIAGAASWGKSASKGQVTAATTVALIGLMQLLLALRLFG